MQKRPKHEPTASYFYLAIQLAKYMMRADDFNLHADPVRTEINGTQKIPISHICSLDKSKSKEITADEKLSQSCSRDKSKPERVIVNESSTEKRESESVQTSIKKTKKICN